MVKLKEKKVSKEKKAKLAMSIIRNGIDKNILREANEIEEESFGHVSIRDCFKGDYTNYNYLMYRILEQAVIDLTHRNYKIRVCAKSFLLRGPWCATDLGLDMGFILRILNRYNLLDIDNKK